MVTAADVAVAVADAAVIETPAWKFLNETDAVFEVPTAWMKRARSSMILRAYRGERFSLPQVKQTQVKWILQH